MDAILSCLGFSFHSTASLEAADSIKADQVTKIILSAFDVSSARKEISSIVTTSSWSSSLAEQIFNNLVRALHAGEAWGGAAKDALAKAEQAAIGFAKEHPIYTGLIVLGVLVVILPWALEALGFGELGIIAESWAARWQSLFPDVTKGSLFSFFQRMGMTWWKWQIKAAL